MWNTHKGSDTSCREDDALTADPSLADLIDQGAFLMVVWGERNPPAQMHSHMASRTVQESLGIDV